MRWRAVTALILAAALAAGCGSVPTSDPTARLMARTAGTPLDLPVRESYNIWLLSSERGWQSAHLIRFGGEPGDGAAATVRAIVFQWEDDAARTFGRITPAWLYRTFRSSMLDVPQPLEYPAVLAGDEQLVTLYGVRLPPEFEDQALSGQMTAVRSGRAIFLVDSVGVTPERLSPAVEALTLAAARDDLTPLESARAGRSSPLARSLVWLSSAGLLALAVLAALMGRGGQPRRAASVGRR